MSDETERRLVNEALNQVGGFDDVTRAAGDAGSRGVQPDSIPGYSITREIHRGGQGVVYQALQQSTQRKVAIKVLKEGPFAGPSDRGRFEREVQILGQLKHPNIVTIHDSGSAAGQFFLVMDYIHGQPLDVYMASGPRSIEETLRLFLTICDAVNAAHLRGVIHRDLKPANIRVDDRGQPYVLDFGLAKTALGSQAQAMTVTGQFVGSVPWAAPEQVEGNPGNIDLRTDVYALGVILYQMLTGHFPYEVVGNIREVMDRIATAEPQKPRTLRKQVDDEVETMVLKCLQKERERRYQTAGELARDIRHYLAGEPIEAKRDSAMYVLRKSFKRYRKAAVTAVFFIITLVAASIISTHLYLKEQAALASEKEQRLAAETAQQEAVQAKEDADAARARIADQAERLRRALYANSITFAAQAFQDSNMFRVQRMLDKCPSDLRGWEWHYLMRQSSQADKALTFEAPIYGIAIHPNRRTMAFGGNDKLVHIWDLQSDSKQAVLQGHTRTVAALVFSAKGDVLVSSSYDGSIKYWDYDAGAEIKSWHAHDNGVMAIASDQQRSLLISGGSDGQVKIWEFDSGHLIQTIDGESETVLAVATDASGRLVAAGGEDGVIRIWEARTGILLAELSGHDGAITCLAFEGTGDMLVSGSIDSTLIVWDVDAGEIRYRLRGHDQWVGAVAITPDRKTIISGGLDSTVRFWDARLGRERRVLQGHVAMVRAIAINEDPYPCLTGADDGSIRFWRLDQKPGRIRVSCVSRKISAVSLDADEKRCLATGENGVIDVWSVPDGKQILSIATAGQPSACASFLPGLDSIVSADIGGDLRIWKATTGELVKKVRIHEGAVSSLVVDPKAKFVVTGGIDTAIKVWKLPDFELFSTLTDHQAEIMALAIHPEGGLLVSIDRRKRLILWNTATWEKYSDFEYTAPAACLAFCPNADTLVVGGMGIQLLSYEGNVLGEFSGHESIVSSLSFGPDGSRLVSSCMDGTLKIWDVASKSELLTLADHESPVGAAVLGSKGVIVSGDGDGNLIIWNGMP